MNSAPLFFFDSHGGLWATCSADTDGAVAFGPTGIARYVSTDEAVSLGLEIYTADGIDNDGNINWVHRTAFAAAAAAGRVDEGEEDDFAVLTFNAPGMSVHGAAVADSE